ncbi:hypothetical protein NXX05_23450 [Bacteroides thetaiotaomicron]|uniref:hypothetical protein n=1 Tax=Bacteroides thetaiotaomicron TaxID=818 RepID=UPI0021653764|nr:hypothetical protein [Bacteroides thetaiotaomicron]MCS2850330.1 hypothetical protein [Bacteroides thetaiotaomicron]
MMNKKKREKTTIFSFAGEGEKEITWNSVINPKKNGCCRLFLLYGFEPNVSQ